MNQKNHASAFRFSNSVGFSPYRIMWLMVFFDLPTVEKIDVKEYAKFRKNLLKSGFSMMQYSVYCRHCVSYQNLEMHQRIVESSLPPKGRVSMMAITDKQFSMIKHYSQGEETDAPDAPQQLQMF